MKTNNKIEDKLIHDMRSKLFVIMLQIDLLRLMKESDVKNNKENILSTMQKATENIRQSLDQLFP
ncbi:MAG: hypothetical protein M3Q34_02680 [bacterium]|nr:hypothetical protein [bacterium]